MSRSSTLLPLLLAACLVLPGAQAVELIATPGPSGLAPESAVFSAAPGPHPSRRAGVAGPVGAAPSAVAVLEPARRDGEGRPSAAVLLLIGLGMLAFSSPYGLRGEASDQFASLR